jgi:fumarate reductase flavoprotein subunit
MADELGYPMEIGTDMRRGGMSVPRLHTDVGRQGGQRFVRRLREAMAATPNVAFVDNTPATGLLADDHGVVGVTVLENGQPVAVRARSTVLASDGFAANQALVREHCPDAADDVFQGVSTSTGDALTWATELGVATRNLSSFLGHGLVVPGHATRLNPALPFRGALLVTPDGRRFVDEHAHGYSSLGAVLRTLPGRRAIALWDDVMNDAAMNLELMRESAAAGAFRRYVSLPELCGALDVEEAGLAQTLQEFVSHDDVLGSDRQLALPLYAAPVTSGILATQGGIDVDPGGRVRLRAGGVLPGLYAGGGAAAGISGPDTRGYVSGNGLLSACGLGWIIGNALADACR